MNPVQAAAHGYHAIRRAADLERLRGDAHLDFDLAGNGLVIRAWRNGAVDKSHLVTWVELEEPGSPAVQRAIEAVLNGEPPKPDMMAAIVNEPAITAEDIADFGRAVGGLAVNPEIGSALVTRNKTVRPPPDSPPKRGGWPKGKPRGKRAS